MRRARYRADRVAHAHRVRKPSRYRRRVRRLATRRENLRDKKEAWKKSTDYARGLGVRRSSQCWKFLGSRRVGLYYMLFIGRTRRQTLVPRAHIGMRWQRCLGRPVEPP